MSRYQKYPAYKDSGVEWIGDIPEHWEVKRLKFVSIVQPSNVDKKTNDGEFPVLLCNYSDVYNNFEIDSTLDFMQATATQEEIGKFHLSEGDVIVTKDSETPYDIAVPSYVKECFNNVICGYHLTQIKPKTIFGKYLFRLFQSTQFNAQFIVRANGVTRFGLPQYVINNAFIIKPLLEEQQAIANFLDRKTAQIDELIAKKESLLKKLHEKSIALIIQAVTKGLDLSVPMKESGVNWIGKIPEHWTIWKVTHGFNTVGSGTTPKSDNLEYYDGDIPWVTTSELRESIIENTSQKISVDALQSHSALKIFPKESIVIAMYGATIGRLGILGIKATVNQACCVFANPVTFDPRFFYYWLLMRKPILISLSTGGGQPNLSLDDLKQIKIPIPSLQEQEAIAIFLDQATATIDLQREKITEAIERLKEYRSALITDAVTGKMDVHSYETKESFLPEQKRI